ncbi:MAG: hypothetical protein JWQ85_4161 [Mucilaginibacter sp.]|jgi:hypothetical protein|nr:hypothetical protein [Mucilaginibacter sp.]
MLNVKGYVATLNKYESRFMQAVCLFGKVSYQYNMKMT